MKMATHKISAIEDVTALGMYDFYIERANGYEEILLISGDRGYPHYYRVELQFVDVEYTACASSFGSMGTFCFRMATVEETTIITENYLEFTVRAVYCFEEDLSRWVPKPERKAHKFFIAADNVDITLYYDMENANHLAILKKISA